MGKPIKIEEKNLHPNRGWILIKTVQTDKTTAAGVFLPDNRNVEPMFGRVLEIGRGILREGGIMEEPPFFDLKDKEGLPSKRRQLKAGDIIIYREHTQHEIQGNTGEDEKVAFVNFDSILGVMLDYSKEK